MLDYLIVGQGISGTLLSYNLLKNNKKIMILDNDHPSSSSRVAAGIFNPVTGKRKVRTWQMDVLFNYLLLFYPEFEAFLNTRFFYLREVYMLFDSLTEQNVWAGKLSEDQYKNILNINTDLSKYHNFIKDDFGGLQTKVSGYVDVLTMIDSFKDYVKKVNCIVHEEFDYNLLNVTEQEINYKDYKAKRILFCEGARITENPYFSWLPFNLVKGELLTLQVYEMAEVIFNKNIFVLPLTSQKCLAGATYNWEDKSNFTTEAAKQELKEKIDKLLSTDYKITGQKAAIRPATEDRRPFIGVHPVHKNLYVFGGLGTKGVSIAPYYAYHFYQNLENEKELEKDVNINRHYTLYYLKNSK